MEKVDQQVSKHPYKSVSIMLVSVYNVVNFTYIIVLDLRYKHAKQVQKISEFFL